MSKQIELVEENQQDEDRYNKPDGKLIDGEEASGNGSTVGELLTHVALVGKPSYEDARKQTTEG